MVGFRGGRGFAILTFTRIHREATRETRHGPVQRDQRRPRRKQHAQHNTAFLIAQFFGWTAIIRREVPFIEFADGAQTRRLSDLRDEIYGLWQTNSLADPLTIWAGEQRAIGEPMIDPSGTPLACIGYANYLKSFGAGQEPLIDHLAQAVLACAAAPDALHDRLRAIQHKLIEMLDVLDPEGLRFPADARTRV